MMFWDDDYELGSGLQTKPDTSPLIKKYAAKPISPAFPEKPVKANSPFHSPEKNQDDFCPICHRERQVLGAYLRCVPCNTSVIARRNPTATYEYSVHRYGASPLWSSYPKEDKEDTFIIDSATGKEIPKTASFHPDGKRIVLLYSHRAEIVDAKNLLILQAISLKGDVWRCHFTDCGRYLIFVCYGGKFFSYDIQTEKVVLDGSQDTFKNLEGKEIPDLSRAVDLLSFFHQTPDRLLSGTRTYLGYRQFYNLRTFSAYKGADNTVQVLAEQICDFIAPSIAIAGNDDVYAVYNDKMQIYDSSLRLLGSFDLRYDHISNYCKDIIAHPSPESREFVIFFRQSFKIYRIEDEKQVVPVATINLEPGSTYNTITAIQYSASGKQLVVVLGHQVRIFDLSTFRFVGGITRHDDNFPSDILGAQLNQDETLLLTYSSRYLKTWRAG